jgi:hypothetical protein
MVRCAVCGTDIDLGSPAADHHPRVCPACGVDCVFLDWKGRMVQIVTDRAPRALAEGIRWAQKNFDELEYVELLCALEEMGGARNGQPANAANHPLQPTGPASRRSEP